MSAREIRSPTRYVLLSRWAFKTANAAFTSSFACSVAWNGNLETHSSTCTHWSRDKIKVLQLFLPQLRDGWRDTDHCHFLFEFGSSEKTGWFNFINKSPKDKSIGRDKFSSPPLSQTMVWSRISSNKTMRGCQLVPDYFMKTILWIPRVMKSVVTDTHLFVVLHNSHARKHPGTCSR